jgi:MFS family permease
MPDLPSEQHGQRPLGWRAWYLLALLVGIFILNQADRQLLPVLIPAGLKCGSESGGSASHHGPHAGCISFSATLEGVLKGPAFTVVYAVVGVFLAFLGDDPRRRHRTMMISTCFWSIVTGLWYFVSRFWQVVILRLLLGVGESVCSPIAFSTIAHVFPLHLRATALSIFHFGVYLGNGTGYIAAAANARLGWRLTFVAFGSPGILLGLLYGFTTNEARAAGQAQLLQQDREPLLKDEALPECSAVDLALPPPAQRSVGSQDARLAPDLQPTSIFHALR